MKTTGGGFILASGREIMCYAGIVGIDSDTLKIYGGYDDDLMYQNEFSEAELVEIAEYMIELWGKLKREAKIVVEMNKREYS